MSRGSEHCATCSQFSTNVVSCNWLLSRRRRRSTLCRGDMLMLASQIVWLLWNHRRRLSSSSFIPRRFRYVQLSFGRFLVPTHCRQIDADLDLCSDLVVCIYLVITADVSFAMVSQISRGGRVECKVQGRDERRRAVVDIQDRWKTLRGGRRGFRPAFKQWVREVSNVSAVPPAVHGTTAA